MITRSHFILYVEDPSSSKQFYSAVLGLEPTLDVPGMTEFRLNDGTVLGLMPVDGILRLLANRIPDPRGGSGIPRSELYLLVDDPGSYHRRAVSGGAKELSALAPRDWGHEAAYSLDADGHVLAFAKLI